MDKRWTRAQTIAKQKQKAKRQEGNTDKSYPTPKGDQMPNSRFQLLYVSGCQLQTYNIYCFHPICDMLPWTNYLRILYVKLMNHQFNI